MNRTSKILAGCLIYAGMATAANAVALYMSVDADANGLYQLSTADGSATLLGVSNVTSSTVGLSPSADPTLLYGSTWTELAHINADGSGAVNVGDIRQEGLAYDPTSGILYGAINGDFGAYDPNDGSLFTSLAAPGGDYEGLAYHAGLIYGLADGGNLSAYDIALGTWSLIGNTGVGFDQVGLAYDSVLDILYAVGDQDSLLYGVNPGDASSWVIGDTGIANGGGLAFVGEAMPTPEPGTLVLVGLGLLGLRLSRKS